LIHKACQVQLLTDVKHKDVTISSVACQTNLSPHDVEEVGVLPDKNNKEESLSSLESSIVSNDDEDIITIVTDDRVSASVLHADSDTSSICVDDDKIISPLLYPRTGEAKPSLKNHMSHNQDVECSANKKSVRFQDLEHSKEAVMPATLDKVSIHFHTNLCMLFV